MPEKAVPTSVRIAELDVDGRAIGVWLRLQHDGIEYVGQLWFGDDPAITRGLLDRGMLPGCTTDDVMALARRLTMDELRQRYDRAFRERRRYDPLRRITQDMLATVRRLNQVAIALHAGLVDSADGADQVTAAEAQLHALVDSLRDVAGIEDEFPAEVLEATPDEPMSR
jgi:hypothetical protein